MNCPKCAYQNLPKGADFCPGCGTPMEIVAGVQTLVQVRQDVEQNLGNVIGVQTQAIQGDVYGGDIYQVQVYALSEAGRVASWRRFIEKKTPPYKFLSPYTARDQVLFKGRDDEIKQVVRQIGEQRLLVVYGQAGVGKTSLLAAGVIPELIQWGALVVHIQDYLQPVETIRAALAASTGQLRIALPDDPSLPTLVRAVSDATQGTLVLVFDQFERLLEPSMETDRRTALIAGLAESLQAIEPERLRLIIAVQQDTLGHLGELQDDLPELLRSPIQLLPLSHRQAQRAIQEPLKELDYPVSYVGDLVSGFLVPDLDDLTPEVLGWIHPPHLQIVCHWLYQAARERYPPLIDTELYVHEAKGADGIMARYMEETLRMRLAGERVLAERALATMASPGAGRWVAPEQLPRNGASPERLRDVLEHLVETGFLVRRAVNGRHEYGFASQTVAREVRRLAGPEVERRYQAEDELERIWSAWLARDALATRGQLRYLAKAGIHLMPRAVKALLLLRSAVARDEPAGPWLAWLRSDKGRALIRQLEEPDAADLTRHSSRSDLNKAALLLGLPDVTLPDRPEDGRGPFGPVAWSAVSHPDPITRQTATLALTAPDRYAALDRLDWALRTGLQGWRRRQRRAELRGTLADGDPEMEKLVSDLPPLDRTWVWLWRVRRRIFRDRHRIAGLTLGGAIGAGLGLGLLRAVIAALTPQGMVGIQFAMYFYWAAILGAALSLGMALAESLLLSRPEEASETPAIWRAPLHPDRRPAVVAAVLGTLFFWTGHAIVTFFNSSPFLSLSSITSITEPLRVLTVFVAGLGLSVALYGQPRIGYPLGIVRWLLRLGTAVLSFVLTERVFIAAKRKAPSLNIVWGEKLYRAEFRDYVMWSKHLALLDAALVGIVLTIGITAGLVLAADWLARWRALVDRASD